jgi:hypothetical protein
MTQCKTLKPAVLDLLSNIKKRKELRDFNLQQLPHSTAKVCYNLILTPQAPPI